MITVYVLWVFTMHVGVAETGTFTTKANCLTSGQAVIDSLLPMTARAVCFGKDLRK